MNIVTKRYLRRPVENSRRGVPYGLVIAEFSVATQNVTVKWSLTHPNDSFSYRQANIVANAEEGETFHVGQMLDQIAYGGNFGNSEKFRQLRTTYVATIIDLYKKMKKLVEAYDADKRAEAILG